MGSFNLMELVWAIDHDGVEEDDKLWDDGTMAIYN